MKYKVITHRIYRIEREIEVESHEAAMQYAEELQHAELPDDAVRSDDLGVQEITES
ncbi:hypothetical protein [Acinetobacter sp. ANC 4641]|uniref:hypothetical protein n=1 Tax=Acinetobacter sp. ANC 4641 TaxID=2529847 RepID=UPI0013F168DF|nr:hypothetical protein [Acinetobacter sp. ANC 4641]